MPERIASTRTLNDHEARRILPIWLVGNVGYTYPWGIAKNEYDVPVNRTRWGVVLFKLPADKFCRQVTFSHTEEYQGGGSYVRGKDVVLDKLRFQACQ